MLSLTQLKKISYDRWFIAKFCRGKKVLELGCVNHSVQGVLGQRRHGTWLFDYLSANALHATGLDIDREGVDYLKNSGLDIRHGNAESFDLGESFDVIIASKLVDHLLNFDGFFRSCSKHLAKDGRLIISDDNILCFPQLIAWNFKRELGKPDDDITMKPTPNYFEHFVGRYGLAVEKTVYNVGTGESFTHRAFRNIVRFIPKFLVFEPMFYPNYITVLKLK